MAGILLLPGLAFVLTAEAVELGVRTSLSKDLPDGDGISADPTASFGLGPDLGLFVRFPLVTDRVDLEGSLATHWSNGWARVGWSDDSGTEEEDQLAARLSVWPLTLGPVLRLPGPGGERVVPVLGTFVGIAQVGTRHFSNESGPVEGWPLRQNGEADGESGSVFSRQWLPVAGARLGLRVEATPSVAITLESGYTVCTVPGSKLQDPPYYYQVTRSDFGLNIFSLGVGVTWSIPSPEIGHEALPPEDS